MKGVFFGNVSLRIGKSSVRVMIFATALIGGLLLISSSVFASLTATAFNTSPTSVTAGTLDAQGMTLSLSDSVTSTLTGDGAKGLQVAITQCSVAWTVSTGVCSGTTSGPWTATALALKTTPLALPLTPLTPTNANILAGTIEHLKFGLSLPAGSEVTTNGLLPSGTVQGTTGSITWTLTETERNATTTNS
jgi:hypothetical protein